MFKEFVKRTVSTNGINIHCRIGGSGPPLLLLHGHPQTHAIWHKVADQLSESFTVVAADLRGYGDSDKPGLSESARNYSKREMAVDNLQLMSNLGFSQFSVLAHDRGARVAHRLAIDHPQAVQRMMLLDIAPTLAMYEQADETFARAYWHWFFLIQPAPLPETLIESNPDKYLRSIMNRDAGMSPFSAQAFAEYLRCVSLPGAATGICEDYRASAGIDLVHDRADIEAGNKVVCPLQILWGRDAVVGQCFDPLLEWRKVAVDVTGSALPCGHYIPEEAPGLLLDSAQSFFIDR